MNTLYHAFTPGFNFWYVIAIIGIMIQVILGVDRYDLNEDNSAIMPKLGWKKKNEIIPVVIAAVVETLVVIESFAGIVQFFDNRLGRYESGFWSLVMAVATVMLSALVYAELLYRIGQIAAYAKYGYLAEKRRRLNRARYEIEHEDDYDYDDGCVDHYDDCYRRYDYLYDEGKALLAEYKKIFAVRGSCFETLGREFDRKTAEIFSDDQA